MFNNGYAGSSQYIYTTDYTSWTTAEPLTFTPVAPFLTPAPVAPPTAIDWLRERVRETCADAFDGLAA